MLFAVSCGREPTVESRAQAVFAAYPSKGPGAYARAMYELIVARAPWMLERMDRVDSGELTQTQLILAMLETFGPVGISGSDKAWQERCSVEQPDLMQKVKDIEAEINRQLDAQRPK